MKTINIVGTIIVIGLLLVATFLLALKVIQNIKRRLRERPKTR